jgi:hypothetical protein
LWHCLVPTSESKQLEVLNRRPRFLMFLNDKAVGDGTSMKIPIRSGVAVLQFTVRNIGSAPAPDFVACISYSAGFTNVVPGAGWQRLPPPDGFDHDQIVSGEGVAHYGLDWKSPMATGNATPLPGIQITSPRSMFFRLMVWSGTSDKFVTDLNLTVELESVTITTRTSQDHAASGK